MNDDFVCGGEEDWVKIDILPVFGVSNCGSEIKFVTVNVFESFWFRRLLGGTKVRVSFVVYLGLITPAESELWS